nr:protein OS-9 isoform X3 [Parasteatoda tepidariorum]
MFWTTIWTFFVNYSFLSFFLFSSKCIAFTIDELKAINYEVDILQTPLKKGEDPTFPALQLTSIFGQEYQCMLPHIEEEELSEKVIYSEKSTDIKELLKPMHAGNCLLKAKDWWTYELCFGQHIKQFHIEDGQIIGQVLTLGLYESDYDWNNETDEEKFKHTKQRYHSQYYVNGTKCDLTGQPRTAEIRIFCEEDSGDYIHRVDEPGTCNYVITVHTSRVCSHPQLKPLPSKKAHTIPCYPLLSEEQYASYLEKLNDEKVLADQKRSQFLNNQQERLQEMKNENSQQSEKDSSQKYEDLYKNFIEDSSGSFIDDISVNKLEKSEEQSQGNEDKTEEQVELLLFQEYDKELEKLKSFITPEKFAAVKHNIQEFFDNVINEAVEDENSELTEEDKNDAYVKLTTTLNTLLKKLDKAEKDVVEATKNLNKEITSISESTTDDKEAESVKKKNSDNEGEEESDVKIGSLLDKANVENDEFQVRIRRLDRANSNGKLYEIDRVQQKKLEQAIKEKLEKYGVNTGGRRIEVKIIKAGYYGSHLTDTEASQFENMITALLTGEQEAIQEMERNKKLEENYKFIWKNENDEEND